jgi:hypothetical protein
MLADTLTLTDDLLATHNYDLISSLGSRSIRSDASQSISEPKRVLTSSEKAKSGRVGSVFIREDTSTLADGITQDTTRVQLKASYNPNSGITDQKTILRAQIAEVVSFFSVAANVEQFLNQEM